MINQYTDITALAAVLRMHMEERKWSLSELAKAAGISKSTLSKIMSGKTSPYMHTLYQICDALGISVSEVISEQEGMLWDVKRYGITAEELELLLLVENLSEQKRRWLKESISMLAGSEQAIFQE